MNNSQKKKLTRYIVVLVLIAFLLSLVTALVS
jgi:hypothetical protein